MPKCLLIHTAFVGDVILALPLAESLSKTYEVSILARPFALDLKPALPYVRRVIPYDKYRADRGLKGLAALLGEVRAQKFDACICAHRYARSAFITRLSGAPVRVGYASAGFSMFYTHTVPYDVSVHEHLRHLRLLQPLDIERKRKGSLLAVPDVILDRVRHDAGDDGPWICMAPGSVWASKRWSAERFAITGRELSRDFRIVLLGSPGEKQLCDQVASSIPGSMNLAGQTSLLDAAAWLAGSRLFVGNDSGLGHLAGALDIPVCTIFGSTSASLGFAPMGTKVHLVDNPLPCKPCSRHGVDACPQNLDFRCLDTASVDQVLGACRNLLENQ